jgi:phosphatidylserine/phosphatidylglycerophosphate/cardiolipin synthase-like enzyme
MTTISICVRPSSDSAFIAWRAAFVAECRGFALKRRIKRAAGSPPSPNTDSPPDADGFVIETVASWVGFADGPAVAAGTREATTIWPIQKYLWSDFMVQAGDAVAYQVIAMTGPATTLTADDTMASDWSPLVTIGTVTTDKVSVFFNRGIVASQWLARMLPKTQPAKTLEANIGTPGSKIRNFLAGEVREKLIDLLQSTNQSKGHIYAALFELDDPELIPLITAFGKRAHLVLGNGSVSKKGQDENTAARKTLAGCDLHDRMTAPRALAHNKFLVLADSAKKARAVWTGSTNWTETGLCTQANNAVLIETAALADAYLTQWNALKAAGDDTPKSLRATNGISHVVAKAKDITLWFEPMDGLMDLEQAGKLIANAKEGILFLMFNPGPRGSLLNDIIELASPTGAHYNPDLYIQGVLNQNPGTTKNPVTLFNRGDRIDANEDVVLPAAMPALGKYWQKELLKLPTAHAMVHSKVVVIDPFGTTPIVMTGSHNMGPRASSVNDENFLIIEGNADLACQYAGKIMEIYNQYRWRQSMQQQRGKPAWTGLQDNDSWQIKDPSQGYDKRRIRELDFWFGTVPVTHAKPTLVKTTVAVETSKPKAKSKRAAKAEAKVKTKAQKPAKAKKQAKAKKKNSRR